MSEFDPTVRGSPPESAHAQQLTRGFPYLTFSAPLEREFRAAYQHKVLRQLRINLWLAVIFVIAFSLLSQTLLQDSDTRTITLLQVFALAPLLVGALVMVYVPQCYRLYPRAAQIGGPLFGIAVAALEVMAWRQGVSLVATVVIATIFTYLMMGLLFYAAMRSALIILAAYIWMAATAGLPGAELASNIIVLMFANLIGGTVCYTLERANRTNYLESCLLIEVASRDGLTGINNRRTFDEHMNKIWQQALRDRASLALMLLDIDHFKAYNDYYGHQAGDECLKQVAWTLMRCARRPLDVTARYGGEEFAVVLYDARRGHVEEVARQIQTAIEALNVPHAASPSIKRVTVSIGAACVDPAPERSHFGFIQLADEALYEAKGRGRNCLVIMDKEYDELSTGSFRKKGRARAAAAS
ncbi:MAG TPA: GGDEF domain-containing protein [Steroidobacteraceae bacterium]|nr:GGDEF domain-containing protein [Steroidobacteraceae bacterium]